MTQRRWLTLLTFLPLFITLFFVLPARGIPVSPDGAWYSGLALNLYQYRGFIDLDGTPLFQRPLFPALLASFFYIFGPNPTSSLILLRLFYVLTSLLVTLFARSLYGNATACVAGLLVISSYALNEWSTWVHLDPILPSFLLLFLLLFYLALQRINIILYILSGIVLGLALLIKETALLFFALPLLALIFGLADQPRRYLSRAILSTWLGALIAVVPWIWYTLSRGGSIWQFVGYTPRWAANTLLTVSAIEQRAVTRETSAMAWQVWLTQSENILTALPTYYEWHLMPNFVIAPLLVVSFVVLCCASIRKIVGSTFLQETVHANQYLALAIIAFLPMIILQGVAGFRSPQSIILFQLLMIGSAWFVTLPIRWWQHRQRGSVTPTGWQHGLRVAGAGVAIVPALALITWQSCCDRPLKMTHHLQNFNSVAALTSRTPTNIHTVRSPSPWWSTADMIRSSRAFAEWADENGLPPDQNILTHDNHHRYLNLFTDGEHRYFRIPSLRDASQGSTLQPQTKHLILLTTSQPNPTLWRNAREQNATDYQNLLAYTQAQLVDTIKAQQISYVAVGFPHKWLASYFLSHPDFRKVAEFEYGTLHLFEVRNPDPQPINFPAMIDQSAARWLQAVQQAQPERYQRLTEQLFAAQLGWTDEHIQTAIVESERLDVHAGAFSYAKYSEWVDAVQPGGTDAQNADSIFQIHQKKLVQDRQNPWPWIALGSLYQQQGRNDQGELVNQEWISQAVAAYQQALQLDPDNWRTAKRIIDLHLAADGTVRDEVLADAIGTYQQTTETMPANRRAYHELANVYTRMQRSEDAIVAYEHAIESEIADAETFLNLGWIYEHTLNDLPVAIETYAMGASVMRPDDPKYDQLARHLGSLYVSEGLFDDAVTLYEKAAFERVAVEWPRVELEKIRAYLQRTSAQS